MDAFRLPIRNSQLALTVLAACGVLLASALAATPALADDALPPSESPAAAAEPAGESPVVEEVAAAEAATSAPAATEQISEPALPGDPMWCPVGAAPVAGAGGCSPVSPVNYNGSFNGTGSNLMDWFQTFPGAGGPAQAGVIWIRDNYYSPAATDVDVLLEGSSGALSNMRPFALTLRGGWTGAASGTTGCGPAVGRLIDTCSPSVFSDSLSIVDWAGTVTLSDIWVSTAFANPNLPGSPPYGTVPALWVDSLGSITLTRVVSQGNDVFTNTMTGAWITNFGAGSATVTVTDSRFVANDQYGLVVWSTGTVVLKNVAAAGNGLGSGVIIDNTFATSPKPVSVTNGDFNENGMFGLDVASHGAVTLANLNATENGFAGAYVDNCDYSLGCLGTGPVKVTGVNNFSSNGLSGLFVDSNGAITVNQTVANKNGSRGLLLNNSDASLPQNVTLTGFTTVVRNSDQGILINTEGAVAGANLVAAYNVKEGVEINNTAPTPKAVTLTGTNMFTGNGSEGLNILSAGAVTLNNLSALSNGWVGGDPNGFGVKIVNQQNVTLTGSSLFKDNAYAGLWISSYGSVIANNITADHNGFGAIDTDGTGVHIHNTGGALGKSVTFTGMNRFSLNDQFGLNVLSAGAITLNKVTASQNGNMGVRLFNESPPVGTGPGISVLGYLVVDDNLGTGALFFSDGPVSLTNVHAAGNTVRGLHIFNAGDAGPKPVTITGLNTFNENGFDGLWVYSGGAVTLASLTAVENGWAIDGTSGVSIANCGWDGFSCTSSPSVQPNVSISGVNLFELNGGYGLRIHSYGAVTLGSVSAYKNGFKVAGGPAGDGVHIENFGGTLAKPVTLTGINSLIGNDEEGLQVKSDGAINVSNVTASYNLGYGAFLNNTFSGLVQSKVTISGYGVFELNSNNGLNVLSNGAVLSNNLTANENGGRGVNIDIRGLTGPQSVTMTGTNSFLSNSDNGLSVFADGNITINNLTASRNGLVGAHLENYTNWDSRPDPNFPTYGSVTITGFGFFTDNQAGGGLLIGTHGNATLNRIHADSNGNDPGDRGIAIWADGNVTLVCSGAGGNAGDELFVDEIVSDGALETVTLKGFYNGGSMTINPPFTKVETACP